MSDPPANDPGLFDKVVNLCKRRGIVFPSAEIYGGLGDWHRFGFTGTAHYLGPLLTWELPGGASFRISPTFGLNRNSARLLVRFGVSYELPRFDRQVRRWFR